MKKLIALLLAVILVLSVAGCGKQNEESPAKDEVNQTEKTPEAKEKTPKMPEAPEKYDKKAEEGDSGSKSEKAPEPAKTESEANEVKMEDNKIVNTVQGDDGSVTVQEYVYENDELSDINITMKFDSEEEAKAHYESITNGDLKEEYDAKYENIELKGDCVQAEIKDEQVEPMKALAQDEMYIILNSAVTTYEITE